MNRALEAAVAAEVDSWPRVEPKPDTWPLAPQPKLDAPAQARLFTVSSGRESGLYGLHDDGKLLRLMTREQALFLIEQLASALRHAP